MLLWEAGAVVGCGVCHCGPGTEAGSGKGYVKFGAVRLGATAGVLFEQLLDACEALAVTQGLLRLEAGVNLARHEAYRTMLARGFRTDIQGVAMHRHNEPGYNRPGVYLIDDWQLIRALKRGDRLVHQGTRGSRRRSGWQSSDSSSAPQPIQTVLPTDKLVFPCDACVAAWLLMFIGDPRQHL